MMKFSQSQLERLCFIDFRLYFAGQIGRSDLRARFGIAEAAATRDLTIYREEVPQNIVYDPTGKIYRISEKYKRYFIKDVPAKDLVRALVHGTGDDLFEKSPNSLVQCELPTRLHPPHIDTFANISRAIYNHKPVEITYVSQSSGANSRIIVPFAFAGNGLRWHVRAYDRKRGQFSDFVVNRVIKAKLLEETIEEHETQKHDLQWSKHVELELVPHPSLQHKEFVEREHSMKNGVLRHKVRAAMAGYILRLWNVDCSPKKPKDNKNEYHLWLSNAAEISADVDINIAPNCK